MVGLRIILDGDAAYPDIEDRSEVIHLGNDAPPIGISALAHGMTSGAPSIMIRLDLPDGKIVLAETSLKLLLSAADAFRARYGDPRL